MEYFHLTDTPLINNQCLICNSSTLNSYVDLALLTSRTSHSDTPVKEKVKTILNDSWIPALSESSFFLCLPCFHLIDQFDALETQLKIHQAEICNKYISSHINIHPLIQSEEKFVLSDQQNDIRLTNVEKTKKANVPKRNSTGRRKKNINDCTVDDLNEPVLQLEDTKKDKVSTESFLEWTTGPVAVYDTSMPPGNHLLVTSLPAGSTLPLAWADGDGTGLRIVAVESHSTDPLSAEAVDDPVLPLVDDSLVQADEEEEEKIPPVVYDDGLEKLNPGERLRVGEAADPEAAPGAFTCCYCGHLFLDMITLKMHVHSVHQPEILTTVLPAHLGIGPRVNCGVHVANVTATGSLARPFVCIFCDSAFKFKSNIFLHYKEKHTPHKPFVCADCQEGFRRSMELSRHRVYYCPYRKKDRPSNESKNSR